MNDEIYIKKEIDKSERLLNFIKGEVREMYIGARMLFTMELLKYLQPEIDVLRKQGHNV